MRFTFGRGAFKSVRRGVYFTLPNGSHPLGRPYAPSWPWSLIWPFMGSFRDWQQWFRGRRGTRTYLRSSLFWRATQCNFGS